MAEPDPSMGYLMHWAARLFRRLADRRLKALGFSSGHLPVLNALIAGTALSQKALVEIISIEQPTMAATLSRMERDGLIVRRPDPADGRSSLYSLTPETLKKAKNIGPIVEQMNRDALSALPAQHREQFRSQLKAIIARVEGLVADEP